jgi:hypothetical protein
MAFTYTQNISDARQKIIRACSILDTPNGGVALTAQQYLDQKVTDLLVGMQERIKELNHNRQAAALKTASAQTLADVTTKLGVTNFEDLP